MKCEMYVFKTRFTISTVTSALEAVSTAEVIADVQGVLLTSEEIERELEAKGRIVIGNCEIFKRSMEVSV